MFRLIRLKPPHGWNAVAWELGIVTLGVVLALAGQQLVENLSWKGKVAASEAALRDELAGHYGYAVEFRVVYPCLQAQLDRLRNRVMASRDVLQPAPIYHEDERAGSGINVDFVLRTPHKYFPTDAWQQATSDDVFQRLNPEMRGQLTAYYASLASNAKINAENDEDARGLVALARPLPLDPSVRYSLVSQIERINLGLQWLDLQSGQLIDRIGQLRMVPKPTAARAITLRYGTYRFCKAHDLPVRPFEEAMRAVPN